MNKRPCSQKNRKQASRAYLRCTGRSTRKTYESCYRASRRECYICAHALVQQRVRYVTVTLSPLALQRMRRHMKPSVLGGAAIAAVVAGFAWITVAGGNTLLPSSTGFASAFTSEDNPFLIYGQFARDFAMSPSVVEALRRIVGTPPSDGMVWSRRARQEKWWVFGERFVVG